MPFCELWGCFVIDKTRKVKFPYNINKIPFVKKDYDSTRIYRNTQKKGASQTYDTPSFLLNNELYFTHYEDATYQ